MVETYAFLKKHESFLCTYVCESSVEFHYEFIDEEKDAKYEGMISVPFLGGYDIQWEFEEENQDYIKRYKNILSTPEWFKTFYQKAIQKYEHIHRLRNLVNGKNTKPSSLDDFFDGISSHLNK